jgi:hypothetical protein
MLFTITYKGGATRDVEIPDTTLLLLAQETLAQADQLARMKAQLVPESIGAKAA